MKTKYLFYLVILIIAAALSYGFVILSPKKEYKNQCIEKIQKDSLLRHVVLFKFKEGTTKKQLEEIETVFAKLPLKIKEIQDFEWGLNNSPEGLEKGFTHCFFVSFEDEKGRAIYLPHPDHKKFVEVASPYIEDVLVFDYWAR